MTAQDGVEAGLARLPTDARRRLDEFARALERVDVDDLPLYVARERQPRHRQAVETAELVAIESGLVEAVDAARRVILEAVIRELGDRQLRVSIFGVNTAPNLGTTDERIRIASSLSDAVTAIVVDERLDAETRGELIGLWDRLVP